MSLKETILNKLYYFDIKRFRPVREPIRTY